MPAELKQQLDPESELALPARGRIGGKLGRAYDELAELLAIDAS